MIHLPLSRALRINMYASVGLELGESQLFGLHGEPSRCRFVTVTRCCEMASKVGRIIAVARFSILRGQMSFGWNWATLEILG